MAMSVGGGGEGEPMMDINTTPLIDVMLVLLIMFIITLPVMTHAVKLDMPRTDLPAPPPDHRMEVAVVVGPILAPLPAIGRAQFRCRVFVQQRREKPAAG